MYLLTFGLLMFYSLPNVNVIDISQEKFHDLIGIISSKLKTDLQYNDKKKKEKKTKNYPEIIHISFYLRLSWYHTLQVKFYLLV